MNATHTTHPPALDYAAQGLITVRLGKTLLFFGVGFNAYLGWTLGFGALAVATAAIVLLFDLAKMTLTKNAVMKHSAGDFPLFTACWILLLTCMSIAAATMFYAYNMHNVSKFVHEHSSDVQTAQQALKLSTQQAEQYSGFNPLQAQQRITQLSQDMAAILAKPATNSNNRPAGNIGSRTENCTASNFYASKYAADCAEVGKLQAEINGLQQQIQMATSASQTASQTASHALATLSDFSIAEGIPGFAVLGRIFYPHLDEKEAAREVYSQANIFVAVVTELLGTCMLLIGYGMMQQGSPAPLQPTGSDDDSDRNTRHNNGDYKTSRAGFNTPATASRTGLSPKAAKNGGTYRTGSASSSTPTATGAAFSGDKQQRINTAQIRAEQRWNNRPAPAPVAGNTALKLEIDEMESLPEPEKKHADTPQVIENTTNTLNQHALQIIWQGIDNGDITRLSVTDKGQCGQALKAAGIGQNNPERREQLDLVFDALHKEGVIKKNPDYQGAGKGKAQWLINENRKIRYGVTG